MTLDDTRWRLDIYVMPACFGCDQARKIAKEVCGWGMQGVEVCVIDLSDQATPRPAVVFAVPTYVLNGRVLSLGNPESAWLCQQLAASANEGACST